MKTLKIISISFAIIFLMGIVVYAQLSATAIAKTDFVFNTTNITSPDSRSVEIYSRQMLSSIRLGNISCNQNDYCKFDIIRYKTTLSTQYFSATGMTAKDIIAMRNELAQKYLTNMINNRNKVIAKQNFTSIGGSGNINVSRTGVKP